MTTRKAEFPIQKVTLNLFADDWRFLSDFYTAGGPSRAVRDLVHAHVIRLKKAQGPKPSAEVNLEELDIGEI